MKTDRELLELAARAAGYLVDSFDDGAGKMVVRADHGNRRWWNPLTNDGDALRLAVKLRIDVDFCEKSIETWRIGFADTVGEPYRDEPMRATRRAIVRAAAAIGESI